MIIHTSKKILVYSFIAIVFTSSFFQSQAFALSQEQKDLYNSGIYFYDKGASSCGVSSTSDGAAPQQLGPEKEGHRLPASEGGTGREEEAYLDSSGKPRLKRNNAGLNPTPKGVTENDVKYYINMRWRYVTWNWQGYAKNGPEDGSWYTAKPRKVLVTNPSNGKSIVATIIESGPAPWTGTKNNSPSSVPSYWQGYVDGTPAEYDGRVSGLSPATFKALSAGGDYLQWEYGGKRGVKVTYQWADDNAVAGTVTKNGAVISTGSDGDCNIVSGTTRSKIVEIAKQEYATWQSDKSPDYTKKYTFGANIPWCAAFASYVLKQAGVPFKDGDRGGFYQPSVLGVLAEAKKNGQFKPKGGYTPVPGDIVIYSEGIEPYKSHVNIVIEVRGNKLITIGGNESDAIKQTDGFITADMAAITGFYDVDGGN